jgi:hypothetical protein
MTDAMKKAFDFAADLTKQLITLATAIIGLTITFTKDFLKGVPANARPFAYWAWYLFLFSIAMGILTLSTLTGNLASKTNPTPYSPNTTSFSILQFLTFGAGLVLTVVFAVKSV